MEETVDLPVGSLDDGGMVMAEIDDCGSAGEIGIALAVGGVDPDTVGRFGDDVRVEGDDRGDKGLVTGDEIAQRGSLVS